MHREINRAEQPSREAAQRHLLDLQNALKDIRSNRVLEIGAVVWPPGLDRTILNELPLRARTRKCLLRAQLMDGDSVLTVQQVLRLKNFGRISLRDLLFTIERFLNECIRIGSTDSQDEGEASERTPNEPNELGTSTTRVQTPRLPWESAGELLSPLLAAAAELHGAKTLTDVLSPEVMRLATQMGIASAIGAVRIDHVSKGTPGLISVTLSRVALTIDAASDTERTIIEHRLVRTPATTLEEVGKQVGVTRERIRQVQIKIERRVQTALGRGMRIVASALKERLGHLAEESCGRASDSRSFCRPTRDSQRDSFVKALLDEMGFTLDSGVYLDKRAMEELRDIRDSTRRLADDVGLVDEPGTQSQVLRTRNGGSFEPWVREHCGLCDLFGSVGIRDSGKARVKAALISIGRPATSVKRSLNCAGLQ